MKIKTLEDDSDHTLFGLVAGDADQVVAEARIDRNQRVILTSFTSLDLKDLEWFVARVKMARQSRPSENAQGHVLEAVASPDFSKVSLTVDGKGLSLLLAVLTALQASYEQGRNDHDHLSLEPSGEGELTTSYCPEGWRMIEEIQIAAWQPAARFAGTPPI